MKIEHQIVVWTTPGTGAQLTASSALTSVAPVLAVPGEEGFWRLMPPRGNSKLYLLDAAVTSAASPGFVAAVATRPSTWPPFVAFGADHAALKASPLKPNSRVPVTAENLEAQLAIAAQYWVTVNLAMELE